MNRLRRRRAAGVALAAVIVAAADLAGAAGEDKPVSLTIAFTGDVGGYLEPCG